MGFMDLFRKKGTVSGADGIEEKIQKVDAWVMSQMPVYDLQFDATIPKSQSRAKYIKAEEQAERYRSYKEKSEGFIRENFYGFVGCNAALYSRRKKHFIFDSINTITAPSFR